MSSIRSRLGAIWGGRYAEDLLDVDDVAGPVHTSGLVQRPADVGTSTRRMFLSINGRAVRDAGIARAVEAAFRSTIVAGVRPSFFLNVTVPADAVDVNVHPAKAEVRFRDRWTIERAVETAVGARSAISTARRPSGSADPDSVSVPRSMRAESRLGDPTHSRRSGRAVVRIR